MPVKQEWVRSTARGMTTYYSPKVEGKLRMDTSTNPLGVNPAAARAVAECVNSDLDQYPSTYSDCLREELGKFYGLKRDNFIVGNGSDEMLDILFKTFMEPGETVVTAYPAYSLHGFFVKINGGKVTQIDLDDEFQLDVDGINSAKGKMVIICTPNNPTSNLFRMEDVKAIVEGCDRPVVVDEAYGEFAGESFMPLVDKYENLIVTRTFSKAYGLAGMRIGYMASNLEMANVMQTVKIPYSLNRISEHVAIAALKDQSYVEESVATVNRERKHLSDGLAKLGFHVFPSEANFILFRCPMDSAKLVAKMAEKDVLIRDFGKLRRLENCVRTTIGTREMNDELLAKLGEVVRAW
jgi:histidinol-phosphate aminotransferase